MKNILVITSFDIELGNPYFRLGALQKTIIPILQKVKQNNEFECKYLIMDYIYDELAKEGMISDSEAIVIKGKDIETHGYENIFSESYINKEKQIKLSEFIRNKIGAYVPDIVIVWESASEGIRRAFPNSLVIDLMPGFMSRPPYPKMISLDPVGIYKNCWYKNYTTEQGEESKNLLYKLREHYLSFFSSLSTEKHIRDKYNIKKDECFSLIPLQISDYFGFQRNCNFNDQYDFLKHSLKREDGGIFIATQYVGSFVSENVLNEKNVSYLNRYGKNKVLYCSELNVIDSISQFIVPYCEKVYSISSTLGMQAVFYGKELISESTSHLRYLSETSRCRSEKIISVILSRGQFFFEKAISDKVYFNNILLDMLSKYKNNYKGFDLLPDKQTLQTSIENYINFSKPNAAARSFGKVFDIKKENREILHQIKNSISSKAVKVVSFDIFDTLLRRDVGEPRDVFFLMQKRLSSICEKKLENNLIENFAFYRQLAEKIVRSELDKKLSKKETFDEEIKIEDVYKKFIEITRCTDLSYEKLVALEQEVEISLLRPRRLGNLLFEYAKNTNKRIIVISDFIHDQKFIEKLLHENGYFPDAVYVSSKYLRKKHTSQLFNVVLELEKIEPDKLLHIGDNPVGDVKMPRSLGVRSIKLTSNFNWLKDSYKGTNKNWNLIKYSAFNRQVWSLFAERFSNLEDRNNCRSNELITTQKELGYAYIGPMMYCFAEWIVRNAIKTHCKQIVFFARDCLLPYIAAKKLVEANKLDIKCCYLQISRQSSTGLDIFSPEDMLKIRIDDFQKNKPLRELLLKRFLINEDVLSRYNKNEYNFDTEVSSFSEIEIYSIVYDIAKTVWDTLNECYEKRRKYYKELISKLGIDLNSYTMAVDIGYKGSIHKKLNAIFSQRLGVYLFMSYSNGYGLEPIDNTNVFFLENIIPADKQLVLMSHNLLFETLINEPVGTVLNLSKMSNGVIEVVKDNSLPITHIETIREIHQGCILFFDDFIRVIEKNIPENLSLSLMFGELVKKPTKQELNLLRDLMFDNSFSGTENIPFVSSNARYSQKSRYLWPEANQTIRKNDSNSISKIQVMKNAQLYQENSLQTFVRMIVKNTTSERKFNKFKRSPKIYFLDSKNWFIRKLSNLY